MSGIHDLRAAVIGCGHISARHLAAWEALGVNIVAVCDLDPALAQQAAEGSSARAYRDPQRMLEVERMDFVDITTRPTSHLSLVRAAAPRVRAVLCQKPLADSIEAAQTITDVCEDAGARLMVAEMWRHMPWVRALQAVLQDGQIGAVHFARVTGGRSLQRRSRPVSDNQPYFADMPRLILFELGMHYIDVLRALCGEVTHVFAATRRVNPAIVGEDFAIAHFQHAGGAHSLLDLSWCSAPAETHRHDADFYFEGADGNVSFDGVSGTITRRINDAEPTIVDYKLPADPMQHAFFACLGEFAAGLIEERPFESPARDNLRTLAVTLACYHAADGNAVQLIEGPA